MKFQMLMSVLTPHGRSAVDREGSKKGYYLLHDEFVFGISFIKQVKVV